LVLLNAVYSTEYDVCKFFIAHKEASLSDEANERRPTVRHECSYLTGIVKLFIELRIIREYSSVACNLLSTGQSFYFNSQGVMTENRSMLIFLRF
jgi:hypothetical protein